jgi:hypothetical protein
VRGVVRRSAASALAATYSRFGEGTWDALASRAAVTLDGGASASPLPRASGGACVVDDASWGEPRRGIAAVAACEHASPVVAARAPALTLRGPARGQGLLLVDGDLRVEGVVDHAGLVVVRGAVDASRGALRVRGALMVANDDGRGASVIGPGSEVLYSSCAVARALIAASRPAPLRRRSWTEVTR